MENNILFKHAVSCQQFTYKSLVTNNLNFKLMVQKESYSLFLLWQLFWLQ